MNCNNCGREDTVYWNSYNKVIQCHHCGEHIECIYAMDNKCCSYPTVNGKVVTYECIKEQCPRDLKVKELIYEAILTEGGHHKQWYLLEIAKLLGIEFPEDEYVEEGMPP